MSMTVGSVTVNSTTGSYSGSGAALAAMDALDAQQTYPNPASPPTGISLSQWATICTQIKVATRQYIAGIAAGIASQVTYVKANADLKLAQNSIQVGTPSAVGTTTVVAPILD